MILFKGVLSKNKNSNSKTFEIITAAFKIEIFIIIIKTFN